METKETGTSIETALIHPDGSNALGSLACPIFQTSTYRNEIGSPGEYSYSRCSNPTRSALERTAALAEGGRYCSAFSSGLAAIAAVFSLVPSGGAILASADIYGGTYRLLSYLSSERGVTTVYADAADAEAFCSLITAETKLIFIETPTNPLMKVTDIAAVSALKKHALLVCDNTFLTPVYQRPLALGADVVVHSATKYLCGHHDTSAGIAVTNDAEIADRIDFYLRTAGSGLSPFDSFLIKRGMETLCLRMERHSENAAAVFEYLKTRPEIGKICYVGDKSHPQYAVTVRQTSGFGGMISFYLKDGDAAASFIRRLKLITFAESLGGNASLITHPFTQTHASLPESVRYANGITPALVRLSVGTEAKQDIIEDIRQALD